MTYEMDKHRSNPDMRPDLEGGGGPEHDFAAPTLPIPRDFRTAFSKDFLLSYHKGTMAYTYRGVPCLKDPIDLALYIKLIYEMAPGGIVEIGSFHGGSSLLFADISQINGMSTKVITVDFRNLQKFSDPRVTFVQADALNLDRSPLHMLLQNLPRPWLVIEDSAHTSDVTYAVIDYFADHMISRDVLIIEDGVIEDQGANVRYRGGPNLAVSRFFNERPEVFRVMTEYTDCFGINATFNPNGYLEKI